MRLTTFADPTRTLSTISDSSYFRQTTILAQADRRTLADISLLIAPPMSALGENVPIEKTVNFRFAIDVQSACEIEVSYFVGHQTTIDGSLHLSPHWKSRDPPAISLRIRMKTAD